ncbi:MAG: polyisoprenoid-binding protein [Chitinophagaceae bacterium]|nr:MAG: polyisoprenoid-binding protein [Chitinophagaceae bacterium]
MKKIAIISSALIVLTAFTTPPVSWQNDDPHTQLGFTVTHLGISDISGAFRDIDVKVKSAKPDFSDASFELVAQTASIDTRVDARDKHLRSADFFNVEKYPTITFSSNSLKKVSKNNYKVSGNLTMSGVTKRVTMDLRYKGQVVNPMSKKQTAGFQLTGVIKRSDFNIGAGFPAPMISDEVRINANGEFVRE